MTQKTISTFLVVSLLLINSCSKRTNLQYIPPDGEFSYSLPDGWILVYDPSDKYKVALGKAVGGFVPNMVILEEYFSGTIDEFAASSLAALQRADGRLGIKNLQVLSQSEFITDHKQRGIKVIVQLEKGELKLRQTFYLFDGKDGTRLTVTCTAPLQGGEAYDKIFEKSMKTFQSPASVN